MQTNTRTIVLLWFIKMSIMEDSEYFEKQHVIIVTNNNFLRR
jgi:hypothetical protein